MRKTFCDNCKNEFTPLDNQQLYMVSKKDKTVIALEVWHKAGYKGGDMCNTCAKKTIENGKVLSEAEMEALRYKWN